MLVQRISQLPENELCYFERRGEPKLPTHWFVVRRTLWQLVALCSDIHYPRYHIQHLARGYGASFSIAYPECIPKRGGILLDRPFVKTLKREELPNRFYFR